MSDLLFNTLLGFTPCWNFKPTNANQADSSGLYTSDKFSKLNKIAKIHLKCDVIDGSVVNRIRESILFSFILNKPSGFKVFLNLRQFFLKKINLF